MTLAIEYYLSATSTLPLTPARPNTHEALTMMPTASRLSVPTSLSATPAPSSPSQPVGWQTVQTPSNIARFAKASDAYTSSRSPQHSRAQAAWLFAVERGKDYIDSVRQGWKQFRETNRLTSGIFCAISILLGPIMLPCDFVSGFIVGFLMPSVADKSRPDSDKAEPDGKNTKKPGQR
ncbi:MAG: hypothetical protein SFZ03_02475 [Candidatus Melainabacteria bacterium]|nr:hypothetical protein [Candidatus Melainabacteria bacterium]